LKKTRDNKSKKTGNMSFAPWENSSNPSRSGNKIKVITNTIVERFAAKLAFLRLIVEALMLLVLPWLRLTGYALVSWLLAGRVGAIAVLGSFVSMAGI
jgi:hypothetical protein